MFAENKPTIQTLLNSFDPILSPLLACGENREIRENRWALPSLSFPSKVLKQFW